MTDLAKGLVVLVEGLNPLAAVDPDAFDVATRRTAVRSALERVLARGGYFAGRGSNGPPLAAHTVPSVASALTR